MNVCSYCKAFFLIIVISASLSHTILRNFPCDVQDNLKLKFMVIDNGIANSTGSDFRSLPVLLL